MRTNAPEILAPAGTAESLAAAVRSGADAVYLGSKHFNARRSAQNFTGEELRHAVAYCHERGVRVYLTLNTIIFEDEIEALYAALREACEAGVDAVLVQDLAAAALVREAAPSLALHASTQMSIHNLDGAKALEALGFSRVVLAREMSRKEIAEVTAKTSLAAEVFVHGALCMSVSGQCTLSSIIGGRSGNRGLCAQPCRLPFAYGKNEYSLSLRDNSLLAHVRELQELGVASLKIEGRMKRPEYVAAAVTACRQALAGETPDYAALEAVFSRSGFTDGYYTGKLGAPMFGVRQKEDVVSAVPVLKKLAGLYKDERQAVFLNAKLSVLQNKPASLMLSDMDGNTAQVFGAAPQEALTAPTTAEKAAASLQKTGGTPYRIDGLQTEIDEGLMLPASELNALRRSALQQISAMRSTVQPHPFRPAAAPEFPPHRPSALPQLRVRVGRAQQFSEELAGEADLLILPASEWEQADKHFVAAYAKKIWIEIPRILFGNPDAVALVLQDAYAMGIRNAVVGNLGGLELAKNAGFTLHGDYSLNIANARALWEYEKLGLRDATVSFELSATRLRKMGGTTARGILAYGYLPLMALRNCPAAVAQGCASCGRSFPQLTDRLGNRFFLDCQYRVASLYNCVPLELADRMGEFPAMDFFTLYFTRESPAECVDILRRYRMRQSFAGEKTRGLYYREVL